MTQPAGPDMNKGCCAAALTRPARQVHLAVLAAFAQTGRTPMRGELERIARAGGADPAAVLAELAGRDVIAFGHAGEIRAAYPFSPFPTSIRVSWEGGPVTYAMCAIDALGISAMIGWPVTITAAEPGTGRVITVHADHDYARWDPPGAVVFDGATGGDSRGGGPHLRVHQLLHHRPGRTHLGASQPCGHRDGPGPGPRAEPGRRGVRGLHAGRGRTGRL